MAASETFTLYDDDRPNWADDGPRPVRAHLWRPRRSGSKSSTVLVSHGAGGAAIQMAWLTEPLAAAGFLVVAVDHHGNNFVDGYLAEGFARWWERPRDLSFVLDRLRDRENVESVGAAGFSMGGYSAAALVGARIAADRYAALVSGAITLEPPPEYPNVAEELRERLSAEDVSTWVDEAGRDYADERVGAAFLVCPAVARLLDENALAAIDRPVAIRWAGADVIEPPDGIAQVYASLIPGADARSAGAEVEHYAFLADNPEFDDVRESVAAEAVAFFDAHLR
jgi:predicted dienelactone hydrolase